MSAALTLSHPCVRALGRAKLAKVPQLRFQYRGCRGCRPPLMVRADDSWEHSYGLPENGFDRETAAMVLRLLTVRAVQQVVVQLMEVNQGQAQWLNNYAAENLPSEGNKFILKLLAEPPKEMMDPITRSLHNIDPQIMAHRILQVREHLANNIATGIASYASQENADVLRSHLSASLASSS